ncbi:choice-of-anchor P family protein [Sulfurimonas sp. HSL-1656]|uniref:choice-of-anchor P family protein n=1 Tax=Thiomicrolovo subterrani TaxID=3131934 RepID=UPI0031F83E55
MKKNRIASITAIGLCALMTVGGPSLYAGKGGVKGPGGGGGNDGGGTTTPTYDISKGIVSGDAYSLGVDASLLSGAVLIDVGPVPEVQLCPTGGFDEATLLKVDLLGLVQSKTLFNATAGGIGGNKAGAHSVSTVEDLSLLRGLIKAKLLSASCSSFSNATTAGSNAGSVIVGLSICETNINIGAAANTEVALIDLTLVKGLLGIGNKVVIKLFDKTGTLLSSTDCLVSSLSGTLQSLLNSVLGLLDSLLGGSIQLATITINEQLPSGNGVNVTAMTNSALHVHLDTNLLALLNLGGSDLQIAGGDIYISATQCGVEVNDGGDEPEPPIPPGDETGFVTGGGTIGHGNDSASFASFGFNARPDKGHINVVDHDLGVHIQGYSVSSFNVSGTCATFSGMAKVDHQSGYTYTAEVCDNGEPGDTDTFSVSVTSGYANSGVLTGGNIQLH